MSTITCYKTCLKDAAYEGKLKKGGGSQVSSARVVAAMSSCNALPVIMIRQIELLAMLALPPRRTLHRQTQEFELPLLQAPLPKIEEN